VRVLILGVGLRKNFNSLKRKLRKLFINLLLQKKAILTIEGMMIEI